MKHPAWQDSLSTFVQFTVTNISKRKSTIQLTFYSPAFHSQNGGYKLHLEVQRSSGQQFISLFARLLKGQHDDTLVWPFQASIVVELVSWREDTNHRSYTIFFNEHTPIEPNLKLLKGNGLLVVGVQVPLSHIHLLITTVKQTQNMIA